ncbi:hypothetical protein [Lewinella sp. IMCC34183]|uniref:hypothetical protein n=1 Tax=Lewinella sp. IMCC34183 TaxID=2248762 RepID=UPI000E2321C4|nr:hypothetical protein [Lewinella sp. IMCC34183]
MATIVLRPTNERLYLTDELALPWTATNLGAGNFRFRTREPVYWEAEMIGYDRTSETLAVRIVDYAAHAGQYQPTRPARSAVRTVTFAPLDREQFCAQLTYYRAGELPLSVPDPPIITAADPPDPPATDTLQGPPTGPDPEAAPPRSFPLTFAVPITELTIGDGYAEGYYREWLGALRYRIPNPYLRREFHPIRGFFARQLRRKTVDVTAQLTFDAAGEPEILLARSAQLGRIDDRFLEVLRARSLQDLLRPDETDRRLFTPEELLANYAADDPARMLLPPPGAELLEEILRTRDVRNAAQLAHLASRQEAGQKLRFVLSPRFGFLFFVRGAGMHHFLLELLDSHATYVWSFPRVEGTLADHLERVTAEVQHLNAVGRSSYRRTHTFPYPFWTVRHDSIGSEFVDGFPRWRARVEEGLI